MKTWVKILFIFCVIVTINAQSINDSPLLGVTGYFGNNQNSLFQIDPDNAQTSQPLLFLPDDGDGQAIAYNSKTGETWRFEQHYATIITENDGIYTYTKKYLNLAEEWHGAAYDELKDSFILSANGKIYTANTQGQVQLADYTLGYNTLHGIAFSGTYDYILGCDNSGFMYVWDYKTKQLENQYIVGECFGLTRERTSDEYFMIGIGNSDTDRYLLHFSKKQLGNQPVEYVGQLSYAIAGIVWIDAATDLSCCKAHFSGGCDDPVIEQCVCSKNSTCCYNSWDSQCVQHVANYGCGDCATGPCCEAHGQRGCQNRDISTCVCKIDKTCCTDSWTEDCVDLVNSSECGVCKGEDSDCCSPHDYGKCEDSDIYNCVCNYDVFCCDVLWDQGCVQAVDLFECGQCGGEGYEYDDDEDDDSPSSDCCETHNTGGCSDGEISDCVCEVDTYCCSSVWDSVCVDEVSDFGCSSECGGDIYNPSDCCFGHPYPGCDQSSIQQCVCNADSFCCDSQWDEVCAGEVQFFGCGECENDSNNGYDWYWYWDAEKDFKYESYKDYLKQQDFDRLNPEKKHELLKNTFKQSKEELYEKIRENRRN
eukprot:TRINITY_DN4131_c0_g1_i1.p1 TRINITY_DN4131_c0_g1~~TRINITY_DN4131_c0_g1_i1.p1  ORF type:complete len:592 (-),score=218.82 TRINITY_DN4131_c0_g1_i1:66-1841(-)